MLTIESILKKYEARYTLQEKKKRARSIEAKYSYGSAIWGILVPLVFSVLCAKEPDFISSISILGYIVIIISFVFSLGILYFLALRYREVQSTLLVMECNERADVKLIEYLFDQYSSLIDAISSELTAEPLDYHVLYTLVNNAVYDMIMHRFSPNSTISVSIYKEIDDTVEMVSHKVVKRGLINPHFYKEKCHKNSIMNYYFARRLFDEKNTKMVLNSKQIKKEFYTDDQTRKSLNNYTQYIGCVFPSNRGNYLIEVISYFGTLICEPEEINELISKYIMPGCNYLSLIDRIVERGLYA